MQHVAFSGRLVMLGFGSIGQGVLPLILRHIGITPAQVSIVTGDARGAAIAASYGVSMRIQPLTRDSFRDVLTPLLGRGDFLLNLPRKGVRAA
jgi:homospermidine synthase